MKHTHRTLLASAIVVLLSTASVSHARGLSFSVMDADNNGSVSEQEFNTAKAERIAAKSAEGRKMRGLANAPTFADFDTNNDKKLTADEVQKMQQSHRHHRKDMGKGHRGMGKPPQPVFADFDANKDQFLTKKEFYDARNKRIAERAKEGRKMRGLANMPRFEDIDSSNDGKISEQEFNVFVKKHKKEQHHQHQKNH
jgi:Ca2+-binding EF-hand superfamily protein